MTHADVATPIAPEASSAPAAPDLLAGARYASPLATGARLQEFEISTVIGQGGFGIVYLARDLSLQRSVAIKEYFPAHLAGRDVEGKVRALTAGQAEVLELGRRSFINEARMLARFKHTGLVEVLRFWEQNGTAYMAMPFYDGATLTQYLKRHPGVATEAWLRKTLKPLVEALGHMHQEDCFHRDVAPDNILILKDGSAVLLDLGAARRVIANDAQAMTVMLKPGYAPIEQYSDDPRFRQGPWTDIYAMAAVLFFAVTGKAPPASASRVMRDSVSPLASVRPEGFSETFLLAIDRGLSLQPDDRPRSIAEFGACLFAAPPAGPAGELASSRNGAARAASADSRRNDAISRTPDGAESGRSSATTSGSASHEADGTSDGVETQVADALPRRPVTGKTVALAAGAAVLALSLIAGLLSGGPGGEPADAAAPTAVAPAAPVPAAPAATAETAETAETANAATTEPAILSAEAEAPPAAAPAAMTAIAEPAAAPEQPADAAAATPMEATPTAAAATAAAPMPAAPMPADSSRRTAARPAAAPATSPTSKADNASKPAATGTGTITLSIKPWAEIRVNGVLKGVSPPLRQLTLPAGRHTIEIRNPAAAAPVKQLVEIRPDQKTVLSHQF